MIVARTFSWRRLGHYVGWPMLAYFAWAVLVSVAQAAHFDRLSFPALPISLLAATLGILLGFRNNSGYDRWWEARTLWGGVVNQSRTFARQLLTFLPAALPDRARAAGNGSGGGEDAAGDAAVERRGADRAVVRTPLIETAMAAATAAGTDGPARRRSDGAVRDPEGRARDEPAPRHEPTDTALTAFRAAAPGLAGAAGLVDRAAAARSARDAAAAADESPYFDAVSAEARELVYAQIGFANALRCHLRRQDPFPEIAPFFRPSVLAALRGEQNVPAAVLTWMATRLRRLLGGRPDDVFRLTALDGTLAELTNLLGGCERIKNTPIPRQYDVLPRVMVRAYLLVLPLGLVRELGLATPLVTALLAFLFLSLDQIGRNVEAPFEDDVHDTPMTALCRTIEINLRQMLGEAELPPPAQPVGGALY